MKIFTKGYSTLANFMNFSKQKSMLTFFYFTLMVLCTFSSSSQQLCRRYCQVANSNGQTASGGAFVVKTSGQGYAFFSTASLSTAFVYDTLTGGIIPVPHQSVYELYTDQQLDYVFHKSYHKDGVNNLSYDYSLRAVATGDNYKYCKLIGIQMDSAGFMQRTYFKMEGTGIASFYEINEPLTGYMTSLLYDINQHSLVASSALTKLLKTDSAGNILWQYQYTSGGNNLYLLHSVFNKFTGNYLFLCGGPANIIFETDANGNVLWSKSYFSANNLNIENAEPVTDGYLIVGNQNTNGFLIKIDFSGAVQFSNYYTSVGSSFSTVHDVIQRDSVIYTTGSSFARYDLNGNMTYCANVVNQGKGFCKNDTSSSRLVIAAADITASDMFFNIGPSCPAFSKTFNQFNMPLTVSNTSVVRTTINEFAACSGLCQLDTGNTTFSQTNICLATGTDHLRANELFFIYPNPVNDRLFFSSEFSKVNEISIYNLLGKLEVKESANKNYLDVKKLSSGLYFMQLKMDDGRVTFFKFQKQ